ncbi:universal stress protein UspE [Planctobacterium marinum]|uniref:Universal stress protein E n=1 Tax=Planctobacterium marinum TaxID=1631968 RepID=A0AA48HXQ6_9ALTE|nr:universal stress protein E [Planctobacterium marinum]
MSGFNKILAVIDPTQEQQKSLVRALELANKCDGSVTAFLSIYDFSYDMTTMLSVEEREMMRQAVVDDRTEWLVAMIEQQPNAQNIKVDVKVVWHNRPYESIIVEAMAENYDLIVKGTQQHDTLKSVIFTPTDWHLLRKAPVSVLLVKDHAWPENGVVLGAVNVGTEDEAHQSLNKRITETCKDMATVLKGHVHLVNSFPGTPINIAIEIPEFDPQTYNQSVKDHHVACMKQHAENLGVDVAHCHVKEGLPEDVIPAIAKKFDAELVVIGTVGRQGISAALIGNTAEHVIDMLGCDVLALKPEGFESPVKL